MPSPWIVAALSLTAVAAVPAGFLLYAFLRYGPVVARIFEEKPLFLPLRVDRTPDGEDVRFPTHGGLSLAGTYLKARTPTRAGVIVFAHEYLGNRWSVRPYLDHLRDHGFDLFTFDFRNHGESEVDPTYTPLQWVTDRETTDLRAALAYCRSRPDADPAGFGLFGVSRGGGTALCVGAKDMGTWGVGTDGAFPARGTMLSYIHRWATIYVASPWAWKYLPNAVFEFLGWSGRVRSQWRLGHRYSNVERAVGRIAPRPWLAIHGQKDALIGLPIAQGLFARAGEPKELWAVPKAKHNRSRDQDPAAYAERLARFFGQYAPRRVPATTPAGLDAARIEAAEARPAPVPGPSPAEPTPQHFVGSVPFHPFPVRGEVGVVLPT